MVSHTRPQRWIFIGLLGIILLLAGCLPRNYLIVDYQLPPGSLQLDGVQVRMQIKDMRKEKQLLSAAAAAEFEGFNDRYNLAWITQNKNRQKAGNFDLQDLIRETFAKRLELLGVHVIRTGRINAPLFQVEVMDMKIDLKDHNWMAAMSCRVTLEGDNGTIAHQEVTGSAQRAKIVGRKGADLVLSELFTDVINRTDLVRLFEQAGRN